MRKLLYTIAIVVMSIELAGCGEIPFSIQDLEMDFTNILALDGTTENSVPLDEEQPKELYNKLKDMEDSAALFKETFQAVVVENGPSLIVTPDKNSNEAKSSDKIVVGINNTTIINGNKQEIPIENLEIGNIVEITYNGIIMESYPAQISADVIKLQGVSHLLEAYLTIIDDIYQEDEGLNGNISIIALDTSDLINLSDWEKQILLIHMEQKYGMEIIEGTFEELVEEGLIDKDNLYFPEGILITVTNPRFNEKEGFLTYEIKKWRSGLGAIGYDGTVRYNDGNWSIQKENMWIS